jgi:hypothetical protein
MRSELDRLYDGVLWNGAGSLRELFTTSEAFVDPPLANVYGVPLASPFAAASPGRALGLVSASGPLGDALMKPVTLDATRPGILTRAGFLAVHSDEDSSGPIARGVFLLTSILCTPPPPRPPSVPAAPAPTDPSVQGLTTRQRFVQHVRDAECASCHDRIDGIGFGFEEFDGLGAYRATENGQPVDASGDVIGTGEIDGPFEGAAELATRIAGSQLLSRCYARQVYRYAMGDVEPAGADLSWLFAASTPDAKMTAALLAIVQNPVFVTRSFE